MRDLFITVIAFSSVLGAFYRPYIGLIGWLAFSLMNPHRLSWGFAYSFEFNQWMAAACIAAWLVGGDKRTPYVSTTIVFWFLFMAWMTLTTATALTHAAATPYFYFVVKVMALPIFVWLMSTNLARLQGVIWTTALSIGFYSVKGGAFTLLTGGQFRVVGPSRSFIADNNDTALAMITVLPLFIYLALTTANRWARGATLGAAALTVVAILGSQSRGALAGLGVCVGYYVLQSRHRFKLAAVALMGAAALYQFMPDSWHMRMSTVEELDTDASAQGRFRAWEYAIEIANRRPLTGGGFRTLQTWETYSIYLTDAPLRAAHSIIFQVLADHGYVGLLLFLLSGASAFLEGFALRRLGRKHEQARWAQHLGLATQSSILGFFASGLFLSRAYFDLIYIILAIVIVGHGLALKCVYGEHRNPKPFGPLASSPQRAPSK